MFIFDDYDLLYYDYFGLWHLVTMNIMVFTASVLFEVVVVAAAAAAGVVVVVVVEEEEEDED